MHTAEKIAHLRTELIAHIQTAMAIAKETGDCAVNSMLENALKEMRTATGEKGQPPNVG